MPLDLKLPPLVKTKAATQDFATKHGFTKTYQGLLGDGNGHIVVPEGYAYRMVYVRYDITGAGTNTIGRAILDYRSTIPYQDAIYVGQASYDGTPVIVGHKPSVLGGSGEVYVLEDAAGIAGAIALGKTNPVYQQIYTPGASSLNVVTSDGAVNVPNVTQMMFPPGSLANLGGGAVSVTFPAGSGGGGGGGTTYLLPPGVNSYVAFNSAVSHTLTNTPTTFNFDTFVNAFGNGKAGQVTTGASWKFTAPITGIYYVGVLINTNPSTNVGAGVITTSRSYPVGTPVVPNSSQSIWTYMIYLAAGDTATIPVSATPNRTDTIGSLVEIGWSDATITAPIYKVSAQAVATANVSIAGPGATLDGYTMVSGDRILLTGQTSASQNGLWLFNGSAAAMTRPTDYPAANTTMAVFGVTVFIVNGTLKAGTFWKLTTTGTITIDTTATTWTQMVLAGSGGGLTSVGLTMPAEFSVANSPLTVNGTIAVTKANQNANLIYAGPLSGAAAAPTFRALAMSDFPVGASLYKAVAVASPTANISVAAPGATLDGVTINAGDRVFLSAQTAGAENGPWIWNGAAAALTRPTNYASGSTAMATYGATITILGGTVNKGKTFYLTTTGVITIDTTATVWAIVPVSALTLAGLVPLANGGTNTDLSATGGANQFLRQSSVGGTITVSAIADADIPVTLTNHTLVTPTIASFVNATHTHANAAGGGQLNATNIFNAGSVPVANLPLMVGDSGLGGTAGLVPAPPAGSAAANKFLGAGGVWAVPAGGSGTVTSVALTMPAEFSVGGSPITVSGTLAVTKANQSANLIYAGPSSGSAAAPTFRGLALADVPVGASLMRLMVRAAPGANTSVAAPGATLDGVAMAAGDRVVLLVQTAPAENGIWIWNGAATPMTRPTDYASGSTTMATFGTIVWITAGTGNTGKRFYITTTGTITIDTTGTTWVEDRTNLQVTSTWGLLPIARGGTNTDLSGTGGANQFVKRLTLDGVLSVAAILSADLTTALTTPPAIGATTASTGAFTTLVTSGKATVRAGTSAATTSALGGTIFDHFADQGNTTTGETDLYTDTTAASTLGTSGDTIYVRYSGTTAANANSKRIRMYFGGTLFFDTAAQTFNGFTWTFEAWIVRDSATTVRAHIIGVWGATPFTNSVKITGLTLSATNIVKITGQSGVATNDIVAQSGKIQWLSAA
jgi:hypothetical protein